LTFPALESTIAYKGEPYHVMGYSTKDGLPVIDLARCPGTIADPEAGWHEGWEPAEPTIVPLDGFYWYPLDGVADLSVNERIAEESNALEATLEPAERRIGGLDAVVGEALNFYDGKAEKAQDALTLLLCHGINLAGTDCENVATHLYGSLPYDYAPLCDECGDNR
jgi:hypothetical protein